MIAIPITLLLVGSVLAVWFQPSETFGYGYGYGYEDWYDDDSYSYGYGYGTSITTTTATPTTSSTTATTSTETTTTTNSTTNSTNDTATDTDPEIVAEVPADTIADQTTSSVNACALKKPKHLKVRHRQHRPLLHWRHSNATCPSAAVAGYVVRVTTKRGKLVMRTHPLEQLHYRLKHITLKRHRRYTFAVRAVLETGEKSAWSQPKRFKIR